MPLAVDSVKRLKNSGFIVVVVTNQPDIGNELVSRSVVDSMNDRLQSRTAVDYIEMCPHRQDEACSCRKPKPGMLIKASQRHDIDLKRSFIVGDRASDIAAGEAVGCQTVFIDRRYNECPPRAPGAIVRSLPAAVDFILHQTTEP